MIAEARMDRIFTVIKNRLLLLGMSACEAPYAAREGIAFAQALGFEREEDIVRLVIAQHTLYKKRPLSVEEQELILALLQRRDVPPAARLDFLERQWGTAHDEHGRRRRP